jgi:hypothetical protein
MEGVTVLMIREIAKGYRRLFNFDFKQIGCITNKTGSWKRKVKQACPCFHSEERESRKLLVI